MAAKFNRDMLSTLRSQYYRGKSGEEDRQNMLFATMGENVLSFRILVYLLSHQSGVEPSVIASDLALLRQAVTTTADALEQKHYIERHNHPTDRRKILLVITDEGKKATNRLLEIFNDYHSRITAQFSKEELDAYFSMRERLYDVRDQVVKDIIAEKEKKGNKTKPNIN